MAKKRDAAAAGARALLRQFARRLSGINDPAERLAEIPRIVAEYIVAEVCSIYLMRGNRILELCANTGLRPDAVGRVRLRAGEGLVGRVAEEGEQLATADAPNEPGFRYVPEIGEEPLKSFIGVPIRHADRMLGVLVVQNRAARRYVDEDRDALELVALVIAEMVENEQLQRPEPGGGPFVGRGIAVSSGIAVGTVVRAEARIIVSRPIADDPAAERGRLAEAVELVQGDFRRRFEDWAEGFAEDRTGVLDAYRKFLGDRGWLRRMESRIEAGLSAEAAVDAVRSEVRTRLESAGDEYLRERFRDFDDLAARLLGALLGREGDDCTDEPPEDAVLVARDAGPASLLGDHGSAFRAVVLADGSSNAHAAVLARGFDLPMIVQSPDSVRSAESGDCIIVDADRGRVFLRPTPEVLAGYRDKAKLREETISGYRSLRGKPARSLDGSRILVMVNANLVADAAVADELCADGIGLYRTEFQFLASRSLPERGLLAETYAMVLDGAGGRPVQFRTLDLGSDKPLPGLRREREANPALGHRALRIGFERPWLLRMQIQALLRAAQGRELRVMFPLVADAAEYRRARHMVEEEATKLGEAGVSPSDIRVGAMLETPSLAFAPDSFLREVDFLSVGGNDLLQFFFAADRSNERVANRYEPMHGAFLRFLQALASRCREHGVPLSFCGDAAADPVVAVALAALGFGGLSVRPTAVGPVKRAIRSVDLEAVANVLRTAMASDEDARLRARMEVVLAGIPGGPFVEGRPGLAERPEMWQEAAGETVPG